VQEVTVLGTGWDRSLGGDSLNVLLQDLLMTQFAESPKIEKRALKPRDGQTVKDVLLTNGRTAAKSWIAAEKARHVLSANSEAYSSVESLFEDIDFKSKKITRAEFEKLAEGQAARVSGPIEKALAAAKLTVADLDSIILHGGLTRTPFVQQQLEKFAGKDKISKNVNSDEAAAFGAAFKGATLSASFRTQDIRSGDAAGYPVGLSWSTDNSDKVKQQTVFSSLSKIGTEKKVPVPNKADFSFSLYQSVPGDIPKRSTSDQIGPYTVTLASVQTKNLTKSVEELVTKHGCTAAEIMTTLTIRLNEVNGQPEVVRGTVSCEVEEKKGGLLDDAKGFFGFGGKKDQEPIKDESSTSSSSSKSSKSTKSSKTSSSKKGEASAKASDEKKKVTQTINIDFEQEIAGLSLPKTAEYTLITERYV
jgi:hypoxia up-regulated 1